MASKTSQTFLNAQLAHAAELGDAGAVETLIARGADSRADDSITLCRAAAQGHAECVELLIPVSDPKANHSWALSYAARYGHAHCVRLLRSVSDSQALESIALVQAANNGHAECVELLIPASNPMANGSMALSSATKNGHLDCVRLLLPVSDPLADDCKALRLAIEGNQPECVSALLFANIAWPATLDMNQLAFDAQERGRLDAAAVLWAFLDAKTLAEACPPSQAAGSTAPRPSL